MRMEFENTRQAFQHGNNPDGIKPDRDAIQSNRELFALVDHWPPSELLDDRDSAYRVGRAFRAAAFQLDQLSVPVPIGEDVLQNSIGHIGTVHMQMHGGRHRFGPGHVAAAVKHALAETGPHPRFLLKSGKSPDELHDAIMSFARGDVDHLSPI